MWFLGFALFSTGKAVLFGHGGFIHYRCLLWLFVVLLGDALGAFVCCALVLLLFWGKVLETEPSVVGVFFAFATHATASVCALLKFSAYPIPLRSTCRSKWAAGVTGVIRRS